MEQLRLRLMGKRFHVYTVLPREGHKAHFDFVEELKTEYNQLTDLSTTYRGKKRTFFVQVNKLINLCITYMHRKEGEGILFFSE